MQIFTTVKRGVDFVLKWFCTILLAVMAVMVTYQVFVRQVLNSPSPTSEIASQYMFVWLVMLGGVYMFGLREHISVTILKDKYSPFTNLIAEIVIHLTLIAFAAAVTLYGGIRYTMNQFGTLDAALQISMGYINMSIPISGALMVFYGIYNICLAVQEYKAQIKEGS